jgi:hypothetical protein
MRAAAMHTSPQKPRTEDAISLIEREIARSERERFPISRQMLADIVHAETGVAASDAWSLVEEYCDERAPAVPGYLQEEFAIPYLKVIAVLNAIAAVAVYWVGVNVYRSTGKPLWPYLCVGTIIMGLGALSWVKSLERYVERKAKKQA